jgi:hypothetical protein
MLTLSVVPQKHQNQNHNPTAAASAVVTQSQRRSEELSEADLLILHEEFLRQMTATANQQKQIQQQQQRKQALIPKLKPLTPKARQEIDLLMPFPSAYYPAAAANEDVLQKVGCEAGECDNECEFYKSVIAENIFICIQSGRLHHCTSASCNALVTTSEHRVCSLTGFTYKLDTYIMMPGYDEYADFSRRETCLDEYQIEQALDDQNTSEREAQIAHERKELELNTDTVVNVNDNDNDNEDVESNTNNNNNKRKQSDSTTSNNKRQRIVKSKKKKIKTTISRPKKTVQSEVLFCEARTFILKLMPLLSKPDLHKLSSLCVSIWTQFVHTKYYNEIKGKYKYKNHIAALLYNALDGIQVGGIFIVKPEPGLYNQLPPSKSLKLFNIKPSAYTQTCRYLHELIGHIIPA